MLERLAPSIVMTDPFAARICLERSVLLPPAKRRVNNIQFGKSTPDRPSYETSPHVDNCNHDRRREIVLIFLLAVSITTTLRVLLEASAVKVSKAFNHQQTATAVNEKVVRKQPVVLELVSACCPCDEVHFIMPVWAIPCNLNY